MENEPGHVCVDCGRQGCWGQCRLREEVWRKREINAGLDGGRAETVVESGHGGEEGVDGRGAAGEH